MRCEDTENWPCKAYKVTMHTSLRHIRSLDKSVDIFVFWPGPASLLAVKIFLKHKRFAVQVSIKQLFLLLYMVR